jgi:hypothetical protein
MPWLNMRDQEALKLAEEMLDRVKTHARCGTWPSGHGNCRTAIESGNISCLN